MRFEEIYEKWTIKRLSQEEAAQLLGVCDRTFRRYIDRYDDEGLEGLEGLEGEGLMDQRLNEVSHRKALVDEVLTHGGAVQGTV